MACYSAIYREAAVDANPMPSAGVSAGGNACASPPALHLRFAGNKQLGGTLGNGELLLISVPLYHFLCSNVTFTVSGLPSRKTVTSTTSPTLLPRNTAVKS